MKSIFYIFKERENGSGIVPIVETLPSWYRNSKRFMEHEGKEVPSFKACVSFFDAMSFGYCYVLPEDIVVTITDDDEPFIESDFFTKRAPMAGFETPHGCYDSHYAFTPDIGIQLPEGYSGLYTQPLNRYELPFVSTSGIIENDSYFSPGQIPFFIRKGVVGKIPKGTPLVQVIPFKRDEWTSETRMMPAPLIHGIEAINNQDLRNRKSGGYRDKYWINKVTK